MIEAQDIIIQMKLADFPNMKKEDRSRFYRSIRNQAYPAESRDVSTEDIAKKLRAAAYGK